MLDNLLGFAKKKKGKKSSLKINNLMVLSESKCDKQLKGPTYGTLEQEVAN